MYMRLARHALCPLGEPLSHRFANSNTPPRLGRHSVCGGEFVVLVTRECLGELVSDVVPGVDIWDRDRASTKMVAYVVMLNVDVFGPVVELAVFGQLDGAAVVTVDRGRQKLWKS